MSAMAPIGAAHASHGSLPGAASASVSRTPSSLPPASLPAPRTNLGVPSSPLPGALGGLAPSTTLLGTGPSGGGGRPGGAMINMDWDEEELSTQIYDRPDLEGYEQIEAGLDRQAREQAPRAQPVSGFGSLRPTNLGFEGPPSRERALPPGVQVAPHAYGRADLLPSEPVPSLRPPVTHSVTTERPLERRNPLYAALAVAGVVLLSFIGYVFLARTEPGMVQLTTHPPDAVLLFDGERVGRVSPFVVTGVAPHEKHTLEVSKAGYRSWAQEVQVQPGQTLQFPVTLQPGEGSEGQGVSSSGSQIPGGFSIETSPSGASILLDGKALSGQTPLRVGNLLPRAYDVRVRLDGYREAQVRVDVKAGTDQPLPRVVLSPLRVRVRIGSDPSGAEATLVRGEERRPLGRTPVDVTLENEGEPWTVELAKSGYAIYQQPLVPRDGSAELSLRASLERRARSAREDRADDQESEATREERAPREERASSHEERAARRREARAARAAAAAAAESEESEAEAAAESEPTRGSKSASASGGSGSAASEGSGTLRINSRPWSQVTVDGKAVGNTPQMNLSLPAGNHRVTLVNPEFNLRKNLTVKIRDGQVETHIVDLQ